MKFLVLLGLVLGFSMTGLAEETKTSSAKTYKTATAGAKWVCKARGRRKPRGTIWRNGRGKTRAQAEKAAYNKCMKVHFVRSCSVGPCWKK